ncbi:MAG: HNH endonuclease [Gammaproteobacteria bacterium]|nr:HNH endonuclease [Gammaproteobacteria bacterium]
MPDVICQQCGKTFSVRAYRSNKAKYCSYQCYWSAPHPRIPIEERFWANVDKSGDCWLWTGAKLNTGYGTIHESGRNGRSLLASRVSWRIHHGPIPEHACVCHHCDTSACVNPKHLFLGTMQDNAFDMVSKGRHPSHAHPELRQGERHGMSKLTDDAVLDIRSRLNEGVPMMTLAHEFNVTHGTISLIKHRKTWKHIP